MKAVGIIGIVALLALLALMGWGVQAYVGMSGQPLIVDCGGMDPADCEERWGGARRAGRHHRGPITYVRFEYKEGGDCYGRYIERGSFTFGFLASHSICN